MATAGGLTERIDGQFSAIDEYREKFRTQQVLAQFEEAIRRRLSGRVHELGSFSLETSLYDELFC
jgi:hypothetical protein